MTTVGPLTIYPQGLALLAAVAVSSYVFWRAAVKSKYPSEEVFDLILLSLVGGVLGGRLLYFLAVSDLTGANLFRVFAFWQSSGMLWYGSFAGGLLAATFFARRQHWDLLKVWDLAAPVVVLGQAISLLPTHFFESLLLLAIFVLLGYIRRAEFAPGFVAMSFLILTSALRFVAEFFRVEKTYLFGVNLNQVLSILFLVLGVVGLRWVYALSRRSLKRDLRVFKMKLHKPSIKMPQIGKLLRREERKLRREHEEMKGEDPLLDPGRTISNPELVEEADELISHRRFSAAVEVISQRLKRVRRALSRMRKGKYGVCEVCGKPIDPARLKVDPSATLCLRCQRKKEQNL